MSENNYDSALYSLLGKFLEYFLSVFLNLDELYESTLFTVVLFGSKLHLPTSITTPTLPVFSSFWSQRSRYSLPMQAEEKGK